MKVSICVKFLALELQQQCKLFLQAPPFWDNVKEQTTPLLVF
jgi:hypothetical protein